MTDHDNPTSDETPVGSAADDTLDEGVEQALRAGLEDFELSEEDRALIDAEPGSQDDDDNAGPLPVLAVVGRPNVGKSTLVNRILGRREDLIPQDGHLPGSRSDP